MRPARSLVLLCALVAVNLAAQGPASPAASAEAAAQAIAAAEAARGRAAELGAEWLETRNLVEQARQAAQQGQWGEAIGFAAQARRQGELAVAQAEREAEAWKERLVR